MKESKDNFSAQSGRYVQYRPDYPAELYEWLYSHCRHFGSALDCATGNGQAAIKLADKFEMVYANDISISQLEKSYKADNIQYQPHRAEEAPYTADSFDLITVAQALHWFDHETYFKQMYKVVKPGALFAAWGYNLVRINEEVDAVIYDFYTRVVGPYWDAERKHVDNNYDTITFPFELLPCPEFTIQYSWTAEHMMGYLYTWSAVQHYIKKNNANPVDLVCEQLLSVWGDGEREVTFPIFMKAGYLK